MSMEQIIDTVRGLDGSLVLLPGPEGDFPEVAWGDAFFYHAPDGRIPHHTQPYGTIVTKNYPDDTACDLDPPGRWRVNIHVDRATFLELLGAEPDSVAHPRDYTTTDTVLPHPVYGTLGWICVNNPGERTQDTVVRLLRHAHEAARARAARRQELRRPDSGAEPTA